MTPVLICLASTMGYLTNSCHNGTIKTERRRCALWHAERMVSRSGVSGVVKPHPTLRPASATGAFYEGKPELTHTLTFTGDGTKKDITFAC